MTIPSGKMILISGALGWLGKRLTRVIVDRSLELEFLRDLPRETRIRCLILPGDDERKLEALSNHLDPQQSHWPPKYFIANKPDSCCHKQYRSLFSDGGPNLTFFDN